MLPLFTAQRDIGGLHFGSLQKDAYSPEDIEFMQQVARQVAVAVDNALNYESARAYEEQLARERDRLRALLEINNAVVSCLASKPLFQAISASLRRTFGLDYASLLIYDRGDPRPAPADARLSGRLGRHSRRCRGAARRLAGGLRLPHARRAGCSAWKRRAPSRKTTGEIMAREGLQVALLHAADLARQRAGHAQSGFAAGELLHRRRPAVLLAGRRAGGDRAGERALLSSASRS